MLRVAPDASTVEPRFKELYPDSKIVLVEWEKCLLCDKDVDAYIYREGNRLGYCMEHYAK